MNQTEKILSQLHDIRMPPAPEGVSLWLLAANLVLLVIVFIALYLRWHRNRERWRREALKQVEHARTLEPATAVLNLAKLLRRLMLYRQYDISTVGLPWLVSLDEEFGTQWFSHEEGQTFGDELYRQTETTDAQLQTLCKHLDRLIRKLPVRTHDKNRPHDRRST